MAPHPEAAALLARSHRLGADPRNTNYAGGNASAKGTDRDPVTGGDVELMWVKGSGGDLGTLTGAGLAVLRLDRLRALTEVYPGVEREDEMVAAFDYCLHGKGGAAPSIDTAMHGLVDAAHVDHLHPDSGIALACAADGEKLTAECFGDTVVWVPWRRPGFQLGLDIAAVKKANPQAVGCVLGGHGITAWGDTSEECERNSLHIIRTAEAFLTEHGRSEPFGPVIEGYEALPEAERRERAAALAPHIRAVASQDRAQVGHFTDADVVLDFLARSGHPRLAALGTSCPDHFLRTKVRPLVLDLPPTAPLEQVAVRLKELHAAYREEYAAYYARHALPDSPAMRGADPAIVLVPGVGMFSFGKDKQTARVAGEFYVNAINVMRGAESVSTYAPIEESEKFRIEYWALEEAKLRRMPKSRPLATRVALVTGSGSGIGKAIAHRLAAEGACVVVADIDADRAAAVAEELGGADRAVAVTVDVTSEEQIGEAFKAAVLAYGGVDLVVNNAGISISKPLLETSAKDWDLQHDIMARGSFLVSREAARVMIAQELGGDIVYIASKNAVFAGPNNIAYSATKADQAHQVRLLAAELGEHGIRVNGVNPDGVVRGSGIFAGGWGAQRAAVYGVEEEKLGEFYAQRTILKREVLPEHVAAAVFALTGGTSPTPRDCTSRWTPAWRPRSFDECGREVVCRGRPGRLQRACHGRPRRPGHPGTQRGAPVPEPARAGPRGTALGHPRAVRGCSRRVALGRPGRLGRHRQLGGRLRPPGRRRRPARQSGPLPRHPHRGGSGEGVGDGPARGAVRRDGIAVRAVQHALPADGGA
ncbi:3-oxoacyl-[acyl-carrier-protein] reductase FabG [Streptomyces sp. MBT84]|nr:3-oxoacyl-[acyl-carrier-protein] reductase FabG [Streptomyces sp. MBT84]